MDVDFSLLLKYLPLLIPIILLQYTLLIIAIVDLLKRERTKGPKLLWGVIILFVSLIGPVVYLIFGRED